MSIQSDHGRWGEQMANDYLQAHGYKILGRNWHYKKAEIDIIAMNDGILVFVEVKTRASHFYGSPDGMVSRKKQRLLIDAAMAYMRTINHEWEIRFDIISITGVPGFQPQLAHFKDAFFPGIDFRG